MSCVPPWVPQWVVGVEVPSNDDYVVVFDFYILSYLFVKFSENALTTWVVYINEQRWLCIFSGYCDCSNIAEWEGNWCDSSWSYNTVVRIYYCPRGVLFIPAGSTSVHAWCRGDVLWYSDQYCSWSIRIANTFVSGSFNMPCVRSLFLCRLFCSIWSCWLAIIV